MAIELLFSKIFLWVLSETILIIHKLSPLALYYFVITVTSLQCMDLCWDVISAGRYTEGQYDPVFDLFLQNVGSMKKGANPICD